MGSSGSDKDGEAGQRPFSYSVLETGRNQLKLPDLLVTLECRTAGYCVILENTTSFQANAFKLPKATQQMMENF